MIETIKKYTGLIGAALIAILSALLLRKSKQLDSTQSELAHEKSTTAITLNDEAREAAKSTADELLDNYERLKNEE